MPTAIATESVQTFAGRVADTFLAGAERLALADARLLRGNPAAAAYLESAAAIGSNALNAHALDNLPLMLRDGDIPAAFALIRSGKMIVRVVCPHCDDPIAVVVDMADVIDLG